jgi:hypothetical protein
MTTKWVRRLWPAFAVLAGTIMLPLAVIAQEPQDERVFHPATHSHNDYYQPRPLLDALESGMASIEADIFYVEIPFLDADGESRALRELYVAHDWEEIEGNVEGFNRTKGTLTGLYLDPLWEIYQQTGGIYPQETLLLHADMKTATETTWRVLENTLRNYPGLITSYDLESQEITPGPVTVYTNEEPSEEVLAEYGIVHSTADGRFGDIFDPSVWESEAYVGRRWRMPIISSNLQAYMEIERMFEFQVSEEEIVGEYSEEYPDLTTDNLASELDCDNWALANRLIEDGSITVSDYLIERMEEASRLGTEGGHLMRFWASPDAEWFWDIAGPLENVVILTDHPQDVRRYLQDSRGAGAGN